MVALGGPVSRFNCCPSQRQEALKFFHVATLVVRQSDWIVRAEGFVKSHSKFLGFFGEGATPFQTLLMGTFPDEHVTRVCVKHFIQRVRLYSKGSCVIFNVAPV